MSYWRKNLCPDDKQELLGLIEDYRQGPMPLIVPLIVPLTLLKHHLNRHPVPDWVDQQVRPIQSLSVGLRKHDMIFKGCAHQSGGKVCVLLT